MTITRDPVGERTVYYAGTTNGIVSASRLRELRKHAIGVDTKALRNYLSCAFVPGERTLYRGVSELRPGASLNTDTGETTPGAEFLENTWSDTESLETHAKRLRPILEDAVRTRLPGKGEPVGVYLSGGLDSSLVAALVRELHDGPVHTFSIHFGNETPHELKWSSMVAEHLGTEHQILGFDGKTIYKHLEETLDALDDPIGDPLTVPNYLLGRAAKAKGIATIFNGEGGDPVFGGPKNLPMLLHALYDTDEADSRAAYFRSYQKCYDDLGKLLTPACKESLKNAPPQEALLDPFLGESSPMKDYLNRLMLINVRLKGADQILTKVANLTGVHGLTAASPLFDVRVVEAGFAIPGKYKLDGAREKAVLKEAVRDLLPEEILTRPKSGMMVPVQRWFQQDLQKPARAKLLSKSARIRPYLEQDILKNWLDYAPQPFPRHGVKLWLVLTLELWLERNNL
jgi:asparagine synthase (glutamine-hydrolysing)